MLSSTSTESWISSSGLSPSVETQVQCKYWNFLVAHPCLHVIGRASSICVYAHYEVDHGRNIFRVLYIECHCYIVQNGSHWGLDIFERLLRYPNLAFFSFALRVLASYLYLWLCLLFTSRRKRAGNGHSSDYLTEVLAKSYQRPFDVCIKTHPSFGGLETSLT